jgi:ABC-type transport system substrate-binding protein
MDRLLDEAADTRDGADRLNLYHRADRLAVQEEAVVLPIRYGAAFLITKPWVAGIDDMFPPVFDSTVISH